MISFDLSMIVKTGGSRQKAATGKFVEDDEGHLWYDDYLYMNGEAIFNFTLDAVPVMMKGILEKNGLDKDNIDYYVFHQANKFMLNTIRKVCVLPKDKFYVNLSTTGNTVSSTVLIGLKDCMENNFIKAGDKVMISGFELGRNYIIIQMSNPNYFVRIDCITFNHAPYIVDAMNGFILCYYR